MANEERRRIIAVLEEVRDAADRGERVSFGEADRPRLQVAAELRDGEYIRGGVAHGSTGMPVQCEALGLTTAGRQYLGELRAREEAASLRGRAVLALKAVGVAALGVLATLVAQLLGGCLKHVGTP